MQDKHSRHPAPGDAKERREEPGLQRILAVSEPAVERVAGQVEGDGGTTLRLDLIEAELHLPPMMAALMASGGASSGVMVRRLSG